MKKGYTPTILTFLSFSILIVVMLLSYVGLKLEMDALKKKQVIVNEKIIESNNMQMSLIAKSQELTSFERIKSIAQAELGMVVDNSAIREIFISQSEIDRVKELLKEKYEY